MKRTSLALLALAAALVGARFAAPHGGKVTWNEPKNVKDYEAMVEQCNQTGRPILLYFTMDGCHFCAELDAGAFSDDTVVKATEKLTRIMLIAGRYDAIAKKFGVNGYPQVFFLKPDGTKATEGSREAGELIKQIDDTVGKFSRSPKWVESEETAAAQAKEEGKPLVIVYRDDKAKSDAALAEFGALPLAALYDKAVWVQRTIDPKSDDAKALGLSALPAMWIVNVRVEDPKARVVKKVTLPKSGAALKTELAAVLKSWKKDEATK
ncbi:MAG TPA: thioredoxin family protein [Planctomycetota bacterium]|nr:thioredoxin family protein [Planctomycetota bacterium]